MPNIKYEIFKQDVENDPSEKYFSELEKYSTKIYSDEKLVFDGEVSSYDITSRRVPIDISYYSGWEDAVIEYLNKHNESVSKGFDKNIEFKILDMDSRFAFKFEEYIDGNKVKEGTGWLKDLKSDVEKEAWRKAVIEYKKNNGIETETDSLKNGISGIKSAISKLDLELPSLDDLVPPLIETAIPELVTDPCNFVNDLIKAAEVSIARINGLPSPVELANYYIKLGKNNITSMIKSAADAQEETVAYISVPITDSLEESYTYFEQLDAERKEYLKTHSDDVALFDVCMMEEIRFGGNLSDIANGNPVDGGEISYNAEIYTDILNEAGSSNVITFQDVAKTGRTATASKDKTVSYKSLGTTISIIKGNSYANQAPDYIVTNRINDALRNCFIPLRLAWGIYCKENGLGSSGWNITSGYRSPYYNTCIGGVPDSAHSMGYAIDVVPVNGKIQELGDFIFSYCKDKRNDVRFDQLLREINKRGSSWCHIGYKSPNDSQRGMYSSRYESWQKSDRNWKYLG